MVKEYNTINEATHFWVSEFNAIPRGMIEKLVQMEPEDWHELTMPRRGDCVYVHDLPDDVNTSEHNGRIQSCGNEDDIYCVELNDGTLVSVKDDDFEVLYDDFLPVWGLMWSFGDAVDDMWLTYDCGIKKMSECGFRIFESDEFGYYFGIDGANYDFYEAHWEPLYEARGLQWHDENAERECQMRRRGYVQKKFCGKLWWCSGDDPIEEVLKSE